MEFHIIIPARLKSSRLPGKMLIEVAGRPLIQHVYERALKCGAASITIATDADEIRYAVERFGASVCMTSVEHPCGTDRLSEAAEKLNMADEDVIVNIQGDEPLMPSEAIIQAAKGVLIHTDATVATLCTPITKHEEIFDPNIVKVVLDKHGYALYFSRAPIPWDREVFDLNRNCYYRHIGLYAYRAKTLKKFRHWEPSPLEKIEFLEQLRVLWNGEKIHVSTIKEPLPVGIDTETDLANFCAIFTDPVVT